jgi:hypothetical protein
LTFLDFVLEPSGPKQAVSVRSSRNQEAKLHSGLCCREE